MFNDRPVLLADKSYRCLDPCSVENEYVDDFHGFSIGFLPVIDELNLLIAEKQTLKLMTDTGLDYSRFRHVIKLQTNKLILHVKNMIKHRNPKVNNTVRQSNESFDMSDFFNLDEAYRHITLIKYTKDFLASNQQLLSFNRSSIGQYIV